MTSTSQTFNTEVSSFPSRFTVGILFLYVVSGLGCVFLTTFCPSRDPGGTKGSRKKGWSGFSFIIGYRFVYMVLCFSGFLLSAFSLLNSLSGGFPPVFAFLGLFTGEASWYLRSACALQYYTSLLGLGEPLTGIALEKEVTYLHVITKAFTVFIAELASKFPVNYSCLQVGGNFAFGAVTSFYLLLELVTEKSWEHQALESLKGIQIRINLVLVVVGCLFVGGLVHWLQLLFFVWILGPEKMREELTFLREKIGVNSSSEGSPV